MKHFYITIGLFLFCNLTNVVAQRVKRTFKGNVQEANTQLPLANATVSIYLAKDTSLVNFCFTTPNGNYELIINSQDSLLVVVSMLGYMEDVKKISAINMEWSWANDIIKLNRVSRELKVVSVKYSTIRMNKDTIEIDASNIKVLAGSDVSKLFKKIPGFEVDSKGNIKVNGSDVSKITVDGSDFFGNNPNMVSKNLKADMIESVQVYDDKQEDGTPVEDETKSINLKLKSSKKKGYFGDALLGYGSDDRYEGGIRFNSFKYDRKFSFITNLNNTNDEGFDFGFENYHNNNFAQRNGQLSNYIMYYNNSNNNDEGNLNKKVQSAFTYFNEFSRRRKLSFTFSGLHNNYQSLFSNTIQNPFNNNSLQTTQSNNNQNAAILRASGNINYSQKRDSTVDISMGVNTTSQNDQNRTQKSNIVYINNEEVNNGANTQNKYIDGYLNSAYLNGIRRSRKNLKRYISTSLKGKYAFTKDINYQNGNTIGTIFNLKTNTGFNKTEFLWQAVGAIPISKKIVETLSADYFLLSAHNNINVYKPYNINQIDFNEVYNASVDSLSGLFTNNAAQYSIKATTQYTVNKKLNVYGGATLLKIQLVNVAKNLNQTPIIQNYLKVLPFIQANYWDDKNGHLNIQLQKAIDFPDFSDLMPILNVSNPWYRIIGNPTLQAVEQYQLNVSNGKRNSGRIKYFFNRVQINASHNYRTFINKITQEGITERTPVNLSGYWRFSYNQNLSLKESKNIDWGYYFRSSYTVTPELINNNKTFGNRTFFGMEPFINWHIADALEWAVSLEGNMTEYSNTLNSNNNFKQYNYILESNLDINLKWGTTFSLNTTINDQRNIPIIGKILNISDVTIEQPLTKNKKWILRLTAFDLFKQNQNISRTADGNFVTISKSNRLQRFVMATILYKLEGSGNDETSVW